MAQHVVHVEDDRPLRTVLAIALRAVEPTIDLHQFISADDAVDYIATNGQTIDLFVLDIRLPGTMNGLELAQKIRDIQCPGHVVLTSAYNMPNAALLKALHAEYFSKPWHLMEITQRLLSYRLHDRAASPQALVAAGSPAPMSMITPVTPVTPPADGPTKPPDIISAPFRASSLSQAKAE